MARNRDDSGAIGQGLPLLEKLNAVALADDRLQSPAGPFHKPKGANRVALRTRAEAIRVRAATPFQAHFSLSPAVRCQKGFTSCGYRQTPASWGGLSRLFWRLRP